MVAKRSKTTTKKGNAASFRGAARAWLGNVYGLDADSVRDLERLLAAAASGALRPTEGCTCTPDGDADCDACSENDSILVHAMPGGLL